MNKKKTLVLFFLIIMGTLVIHLPGINWGVPGKNTIKLVFGDEDFKNNIIPEMVKTRETIRKMFTSPGDEYDIGYNENEIIDIKYNNHVISIPIAKINAMRTYCLRTYYPDEHTLLTSLINIKPKQKKFSPKVLVPGPLYIFFTALWLGLCKYLKLIDINSIYFYLNHPCEIGKIYISIRVFLLFTLLFTTYLIWILTKKQFGKKYAFISALLFGISPVLNLWNHYGYYYVFALPFIIGSYYYGLKIIEKHRSVYYIKAGMYSSFAASVLLLYGLSLIFPICAATILLCSKQTNLKEEITNLIKMFSVFIILSIIIYISIIIDVKNLQQLIGFEKGSLTFSPHFLFFTFASLKSAIGWPFLITAIGGYILLLSKKKKDKEEKFLISSIIVPFLVFSSFSPWYMRRAIFLIPFMAILASVFLNHIQQKNKIIGNILIFLVISWTFLYSASYTRIFAQENIRDEAGEWINSNISEGTTIGLLQMPAPYRTPPFQFYRYNLVPILWDKEQLEEKKPEYFIISEYEMLWQPENKINNFFSEYCIVKDFKKPASILGITFNRTKFSAKDFWPANPEIIIYRREDVGK